MAGAPKGNTNSSKSNRLWAETIRRAVVQQNGKKLRDIADKLVEMAAEGNIMAMRELGDRLDGKAVQAIEGTGEDGAITITQITRRIIKAEK